MDDGADAHRRPPPPRSSRRRNCRRRPPAGSGEDGQEPRFRVAESGLSPRRSGTRSESRASSFPAPVLYPDGSVGIPSSLTGSSSSSAAPLVDGGPADPDLPTLPHGITLFDPDGGVRGPFTPGEVMGHATTHGRRRPGTHSQASSSAPRSNHRGAEGGTRVRQSVLYSDRVRHSQPRRLAPVQEHVTSSIEVCSPVINVPTVEALSLSDQPLSIPENPEETFDETPGDFGQSAQSAPAPYTYHPKGISRSMVLSLGPLVKIVSTEKKPEPEIDTEEGLRLLREYIAAQPKNFWEAVDLAKANERATLAALAAKWRTEGPREVPQQASVAAYPQHSMSEIASRCDASNGETSQTGNEWMKKEVMLCFKKYVERSPDNAELVDYHLGELLHQCFNVESYDKVFHHYNFTVRMKMPNSVDWTMQLYFAEAKEIFMRKYYVCYPLEPNENGCCYACKIQGVNDLRHPAIDVFERGSPDSPCGLWYTDE